MNKTPVPSPCNSICILEGDTCSSCGRTIEEVVRWPVMSEEEKRKVVQRVYPSLLEE